MLDEIRAETGGGSLDLGECANPCTNCGTHLCDCDLMLGHVRVAHAPIVDVEVRDSEGNGDGTWTMSGYAAVFDSDTTLYDGNLVRLTESVAPAAFDRALREQGIQHRSGVVHFNYGHDMNSAVAATDVPIGQPGSLTLRADERGLFFHAKVDQEDPDARRLAVKMRNGVVKQASFAFTIAKQETNDRELPGGKTEEHRRILDVGRLYDVCAVPQGAYADASSELRSYMAAIGHPVSAGATLVISDQSEGEIAVIPNNGGGVVSRRKPLSRTELLRVEKIKRRS